MKIRLIFAVFLIMLSAVLGCSSSPVPFDENEAFEWLKVQSEWLHRYPGGEDADKCREFIKEKLMPCCDLYTEQSFSHVAEGRKIELKNIIGIISPKAKEFIILASHYDNRPMSDKETDREKTKNPCPGANDGASSTSVLLELAKVFKSKKPNTGIIFVFFDGEDYGYDDDNMYLGSKYFAKHIDFADKSKIKSAILLDMIGDKDLKIYIEDESNYSSPEEVQAVWKTAEKLGYRDVFVPSVKYAINDDHIPLIEAGIKSMDIIDFDYKYWHKNSDTYDKCSPKSLKIIGEVISGYIYSL